MLFTDECDSPESNAMPALQPKLQKLSPSPCRSLGGYLDYSEWNDRTRFMELDSAIMARREEEQSRNSRSNQSENVIFIDREIENGWRHSGSLTRLPDAQPICAEFGTHQAIRSRLGGRLN
jgi:hypothetical protein